MPIDPSRRDIATIATSFLVSDVAGTARAAGSSVPAQTIAAGGRAPGQVINVADFGAIGDGSLHPLSSRFKNMEEARAAYPTATSMADSIDGAAIQTAFDHAERQGGHLQAGGRVFIPAGRYPLSRSLRIPNGLVIEGEGAAITIIDNQNVALAAPLIVNKNPRTARFSLHRLSLHGGSHGVRIDVADYVDGILMDGVAFQLQSDKNLECNKLFQIAAFRNCTFGLAPFGVYVAAWTSNVVSFEHCSFENHSKTHLHLRGAECINISGGRFEGGGTRGTSMATLDLEAAASVNFTGVYFENTHEILLRERRSRNGVRFSGCHFSGATGEKGLIPYRFDSDGIVQFETNDWGLPTTAPAKAMVSGLNAGLATSERLYLMRTARDHHIRSERIYAARGLARDLLAVRIQPNATPAVLAGTLALTLWRTGRDGLPQLSTFRFIVAAGAVDGHATLKLDDAAPGAPMLRGVVVPGKATVAIALPEGVCEEVQWTFEGSVSGGEGPVVPFDIDLD